MGKEVNIMSVIERRLGNNGFGQVNEYDRSNFSSDHFQVARAVHFAQPSSEDSAEYFEAAVTVKFAGNFYESSTGAGVTVERAYLEAFQNALGESYREVTDIKDARFTAVPKENTTPQWAVRTQTPGGELLSFVDPDYMMENPDGKYLRTVEGLAVGQAVQDSLHHQLSHPIPEKQEARVGKTIFVIK